MTAHAEAAIRAAKNMKSWGRHMTFAFCKKRGVPLSLLTLARVLEAAQKCEKEI